MKKLTMVCAAACCGALCAAEATNAVEKAEAEAAGWAWAPGEGLSFNEQSVVSAEVSFAFDSKFMSYGLVDNKDPILTPAASVTFLDTLTFEVSALFDVTKYGKKAGYSNRAGRYIELDPGVSVSHDFTPEDVGFLPTTVTLEAGYMYEYHPRSMGKEAGDDTQFATFGVSLPDLWIEPAFTYERDIDRDDGTYLNLELGHSFPIIDGAGEDDDPVLAFRPSVAQGFGNAQRVKGYLCEYNTEKPLDHAGLMDLCVKGELVWTIGGGVSLSGYVAYYDFVFDRQIRDAARGYEATGRDDNSWNFVGGLALAVAF